MGLFDWLRRREDRAEGEVEVEDALLRAILGRDTMTREIALQVPTVSGGIDLIAGIIAQTPIGLYKEENGKTRPVNGDPRLRLLNDEPEDNMDANQFWRAVVADYYLGKGAYIFMNRRKGKVVSLHYVPEDRISVQTKEDPIFKDFDLQVNGQLYQPRHFIKILRNSRDGATGTPITTESAKLIQVAYRSMVMELAMATRGGNKKGFLQSDKPLSDAAMEKLKAGWKEVYGAQDNSAMVLNNGVTFKECTETAAELQLDENKKTNANEFAKIFHVSPDVVSGRSADLEGLVKLAAIPLMTAIQCALNKDLLLEREKGSLYFAFDTKELLKGSLRERMEAYKTAVEANIMQIDEVRFAEDLEPLGLSWIKLGLQDVLYDPKTKTIYTPNTNQTATMGEKTVPGAAKSEDPPLQERADDGNIEERGNPNHDPTNGRFTSGAGGTAPYPGAGPGANISKEAAGKNIRTALIGTTTSDGRKVKSVHPHAVDQIIARDVHVGNIKNAFKHGKPRKGNKPNRLTYEYRGTVAVFDTKSSMLVTVKYVGKEGK